MSNPKTQLFRDKDLVTDLVRLQDRTANLAAGWLQGGWSENELPELMDSGMVSLVLECVENVEQNVAGAPDWFNDAWHQIKASIRRLKSASGATPSEIQPVLLLVPLVVGLLLDEVFEGNSEEADQAKSVSPEFLETLITKATELGEDCGRDLRKLAHALEQRSSHLLPK
jgi:hypothetical protein